MRPNLRPMFLKMVALSLLFGAIFGRKISDTPKQMWTKSNGGEVVKVDEGHSKSMTVGKSQVFFTDISKIYSIPK
jgi:hypothetical protein